MKKYRQSIIGFIAAIVAVATFVGVMNQFSGEHFSSEQEGLEKRIDWTSVNLRTKPSTAGGSIIDTLKFNEPVTLTGYTYEYIGGDDTTESWHKVITKDGQEGWVVSTAIQWR